VLAFDDATPHWLVGGRTGSGKTVFLLDVLYGLATRYSPDELALYLLDFKEGVSFARLAPSPRDPSWLPHVRLVGVNCNDDREFGLALLRFLRQQLRLRAEAAKRVEASKLEELRVEDPGGHWPRIVAVIDEFQILLAGRDALATEAVTLLEDLARRGRSQGIHLVLASQDVSGIDALWGRSALVAQFTLRIALPKARRILTDTNFAADAIGRYHAVVNPDSGAPAANHVTRVPDATGREHWRPVQEPLWRRRPAGLAPPRLFDGDHVPDLPDLDDLPDETPPAVVLGQRIAVEEESALFRPTRVPGRNLAVLGTRADEACAILASAALCLARRPVARLSLVCLDEDATATVDALVARLPAARRYDTGTVEDLLADTVDLAGPHYLVLFGADAAPGGRAHLRTILDRGPEHRVHVFGWWRSVARLREDLGGAAARFDAIGAWVALDVHAGDVAPLCPRRLEPPWRPRPWRALHFDRALHHQPEVIIPYRVPA